MTNVHSVTGVINSEQLGFTLIHEHLRTCSEALMYQFPRMYDEDYEAKMAIEQIKRVQKYGVKTICDPTVYGLGRNVKFMERVAKETGIQIIASTGLFTFHYLPTRFQVESVDFMANQFVKDIKEGIQGTNIRAGFLKCATDEQGMTPDVEKVIRAVARAHHQTGVPIMTHSHPASGTGLKQLEIFMDEQVDPKYVLIGHCGDTDDIKYIQKIIELGAYVGLDRYGLCKILSADKRNETTLELIRLGYGDRIFLSQDYCCTTDRYREEAVKKVVHPNWSMTYLMEEIIPTLKRNGVTDEQIHMIMVENTRRWFSGI